MVNVKSASFAIAAFDYRGPWLLQTGTLVNMIRCKVLDGLSMLTISHQQRAQYYQVQYSVFSLSQLCQCLSIFGTLHCLLPFSFPKPST